MNIHNYYTPRNLILAAVLTIGFASSALAQTQERSFFVDLNSKTATDLGTLISGGYSLAYGINDMGRVVGESLTHNPPERQVHAFITGPNGIGMTDLGTLYGPNGPFTQAYGINDMGQVVGYSQQAFITGPNGVGMTNLGTIGGGDYSEARGINDAGQVAGSSSTNGIGPGHAFITGPNGVGITDLGTLGGAESYARGINDAGQVVGGSSWTDNAPPYQYHAFITGPNGAGMTDLGTLGGDQSGANGINNAAQVVGYSDTATGQSHAFITGPNGGGMTDLGTLGGGGSSALGINDAGQVVGHYFTAEGAQHAFITGPNGVGMTDLNSLVSLPGTVVLTDATAINNQGQVAVIGTLIPEPETYAMLLAGLSLVGFIARRRKTA
jgi:probable HAF family extracellular repeat protein